MIRRGIGEVGGFGGMFSQIPEALEIISCCPSRIKLFLKKVLHTSEKQFA